MPDSLSGAHYISRDIRPVMRYESRGNYSTRKPATDRRSTSGCQGERSLTSSFCALELTVIVKMRCRVLQFEVRAFAATRWWKVFTLDARHLERVFATVVHH